MAITLQKLVIQQNFQLASPPKSGSPVLPMSTEMENLCQPLRKNGKMAITLQKLIVQQNFQLPSPPKSGSPVLPVLMETENLHWPLRKNGPPKSGSLVLPVSEMALTLQKLIVQQNFQLPSLPKSGSLVLPVSTETENLHQPLRKNGKMALTAKTHHTAKFSITGQNKVWVSGSPCVYGNGKFVSAIEKK